MNFRKSIRLKILLVVSTIVLVGLSIYVFLAINTFKRDKITLIYDLNRSTSTDLATEFNGSLQAVGNDFKLFVETYNRLGSENSTKTFKPIVDGDPNLVEIALYQNSSNPQILLPTQLSQNKFMTQNQLTSDFFNRTLVTQRPIPFTKISEEVVHVWNATIAGGPPLLGVGIKIVRGASGNASENLFAVGYVKADSFLKSISQNNITSAFLLDNAGKVLVHSDLSTMTSAADFSQGPSPSPLIESALANKVHQAVLKFKQDGQDYIGAYSTVEFGNLIVVTETEYAQAFIAIHQLVNQSLVFALAIMSLSFLIIMIFSQSLTKPLTKLMDVMKKVSAGDLGVELKPDTIDEIGVLTGVFNRMVTDLKESRNQLLELNKNLEEKVKDRTKQLEEMAVRDALTGMYNRRYFNEKLADELSRSNRSKKPVSIVYLDIDHFKKYNDGNGHPQGDTLLKMFAKIIQGAVRKTDSCARLGGEEFCVILPETALAGAVEAAEKIRKAVESTDFPFGEKQPMGRITCSLGVSEYPLFAKNEEDLVKVADEALYKVKESGRNRVGAPTAPPLAAASGS